MVMLQHFCTLSRSRRLFEEVNGSFCRSSTWETMYILHMVVLSGDPCGNTRIIWSILFVSTCLVPTCRGCSVKVTIAPVSGGIFLLAFPIINFEGERYRPT